MLTKVCTLLLSSNHLPLDSPDIYDYDITKTIEVKKRPVTMQAGTGKLSNFSKLKNKIFEPAFGTPSFGEPRQIIPNKCNIELDSNFEFR